MVKPMRRDRLGPGGSPGLTRGCVRTTRRNRMQLEISAAERDLMIRLAENALAEMRVEVRRTRTPQFHDGLRQEEGQLSALLDRLRGAR